MPEQKKYLIEIPDMPEGSGIWDAAKWERHKDAFMKKYPTANVFEVGQYDANDTDENDQFMLTFENDPESSGIWDASKWERHKDAFTAKYPDAQVNRVRYVDYWGDAAKQNRARREELNQPDPERDARLAEIGYFDDVSGERKQFDMNSPAAMGLKPVSSAIKQNSVSGETEYLDPKVAEFYANDTAYTERLAERARLDAEYESNPSVIAERKWLAEMEKEKAAYVSKMREETQAAMEKNVDKSAWARGYARKHNPGVATSFATSGDYSKEALAGSLANEKAENYKSAMAYWDKAERVRKEHTTFVQGAKNVAKNWWEEYQSQDDIETFAEVTSILKRLEKEHGNLNEISDEAIEKSLTEDEKYLVRSFFEYSSAMAEAGADMTSWYKGGQIAAEAVPFMLEILATGGFYKAAGDATVGAARKGLAKWIMKSAKGSVARAAKAKTAKVLTSKAGQGIISALAGTAARTAVAPGTYTRMAEATTHIDDEGHLNIVKNMGVAAVDAYIENLSEESGIIFKKLFGIAGKDVKELGKALGGNTFARMGQTLGKNSVMQAIAKGYNTFMPKLEALGFHGLPEEIGEEILGNALREATFVQPGALQEMFVDGNFGTMLIGFAPMTILGAAGSAANIGYVNMEAARMGKQLRERMSGHYRDEQINLLMSGIQSAENAQQVQEAISPIIAAIERRKDSGEISVQQALADVKAVYDYGMLVAKNKAMLFAQGEQNRELADAQRAKLFDTYGKFWREDAKGNQLVQTARLNDGRSVFVLSEPAEDGKITIIDMKDGKKGFANTSDIAQVEVEGKEEKQSETATRSLDRYIDGVIASQTQSAEAVRMGNERNAQIDALRARITDGTKINLGTEGSPVIVIARGTTREGVRVVDSTGAESLLGWEQAADALGTPIKVKTDKELVDEEIAAIAKRNEERRRRSQVSSQSSQQTSQQVATDAANTVQEENKHIPLNEDGTVNEAAFWEQSPEEYAAWNDEQNQDGGADTLEQIANAKNELAALVTQAQSAVMTSNPATRKAAKREVQRLQERLARIEALEQKYLDRAVAPYRQRAQMWMKQTGTQIHLVETEEELAKISTSAAMQSAAGGIVRGLAKDGKAYIYLPGITSESEVDEVFMHETVAHLGLLGLLGQQKYDELCAQVWQMMSEEARRTFLSYAGGQKGPLAAADEYIAHIAERIGAGVAEETELTVWEKIMEIVRNFLRELGFNITMTEQELSALLTAAYADLAKNMKSAEQIAGQKKESREAEAKESRSKTEMKYAELAETLTPEEIVAVAYNDYNAAKEAYETHRKNSLEVMSGESSKSYVERKKAYLEELARLRDQLKEEEEFVDLVRRMTIGETDVALKLLTLQRSGFEVDEQNDDARFSVRYLPTMEQRAEIIDSIVEVTGQPRDVAERWLDSELSLASIVLNDREYLDYAPDAKYKAIKDNSDYPQGTVDFNNICRKRKDFTRMYTRLQRSYPNRIFTAENLADIRTIMSEDGLTVACGLCYVEDRRQKLGEVANAFIEDLQNGFKNYAKKNETKKANAAQFMVLVGGDTYVPSIYDLITLEGSDKLYEEHRGIWEAFGAYNRARGQQTQNTFQGYAEYKREILSWSDAKVKKVNSLGGLRIFSYSDFEAHHLLDIVQIIIDCAARGVMIQGYTKVPEFARVVEKTGIKLNRSLIPLGDTGIVDGKLAYDPVEGIDINDPNFLESNDNIGNILIGINDEQIRLAMADPFIHYIIPYHARQAGTIRAKLNVGAWTNYIDVQNERDINTGKRVKDNINIYTEVLDESITNDRQFVEKYLDVCREKGFIPKFDQFLDKDAEGNYVYTPGYYKFLVDFKLFDETGNILPQKPVVAQFDDAFNAQILEDYAKDERESTGNQMNATYDRLVSALNLGPAEREDVRFSAKDIKDLSPEEGEKIIKENIQKRMRDLAKAENFIQQGLSKGKVTGRFEIALPIDTQRKIKAQMGRDFDSHNVEIGGVRHALKNHGEGGKKLEATSIPITEEDVQLIPYIMVAPDRVEKGSTDGTRESVKFLKNIADGYVVVIEKEWIDSADDLDTINMWAEKKLSNAALPKGQVSTSETVRISRSDAAKIRKDAENAIEKDVRFSIIAEKDADYLAAVEHGDMETAQRMVIEAARLAMPNTKIVDKDGNPRVVYHGSTAMFTVFDKSRIGSATGTADGRGFYFTTDRDYALGYKTPDGQLFEVFLNIEKPLSYDKKTITKAQLRKILKEADRVEYEQEGEHYMLSNYANYNDVGIDGAVNEGANLEYDYADNDVELIGSLIGGSGSFDLIMDAVKKVTGKSGMIAPKDNGTIHYVVTDPTGIKSAEPVTYDNDGNVIPLSERFNPENEDVRFSVRTAEQREKLFEDAKAEFGLTDNFKVAGYMLPDGSLLNFGDPANPTTRAEDHRAIEGVIMENGTEYEYRWMYLADFMNEGAIRLLPEYAGINLMKAPTKEQRQRLMDFIYKFNGEVILEIADERLNNIAYVEYDRRTSPARIFRDIDGYFNEGIVPEQDVRFSVNENPTEAQKEAGNYKMGHLNLDGYRITIENPKGSVRRGTDSKGNAWENTLNNDYGYIRGTEGVDGDHIDVYLSDNPSEGNVFVIDQVNPETREFDEHKVMYGFNSAEEAREAYLANFSEGWNGLGTITEVSKDEFKKWIQSSHRKTKPFSEYKSVNAISSQSEGGKAEERNELTAEEKMAINGLFPGAFAEDEDVRFSIRRTDETAEEFTQRAIDDYRSRYAEIVPMHLVEVSSRKSVAAAFGVEEDELPEDIYQNVLRRYELGDVGFYFPGEDKFIIIFARDEIRDGKELEDALIHENIHALINTRTNAPLRVGKWLYDNPVDKVMRDIKDAVIAKYPADRHYEEMLTNWLAPYMVFGGSRKALEKLPVEYRPYIQYIYNELGYDSEREDKRRRAAGAGSASVSEMEPTKMSGSTPSEGGTRKGLERNEAKERPRVVWGKPETDKDTRLSYVPAPGEIELAATKGIATLTYFNVGFDEMRRIFEESISSEEQNIARINEKPTKTAYDMERLRRAERELMASQMRLDWWNSVNDRLINTSLVEADVKSALQDTEPRNIAEYLSQFFTMRVDRVNSYGVDKDGKPVVRKVNKKVGVMLTPETLEKELGWSSKDWSGIGYIVSAKDGRSLDAIAEMISEDADAQPFIAGMDTMDIKNEIISFIQSVGSYTEIRDYIKNERTKEAQGLAGYVNGKIQERINGIEESTGMSVDEYNARIISEAIAELEDSLVSLETSEIFGNFEQLTNDDYEGYIEAVSRGEDGGAYEGAEDLSEAGDYGGRVDSKDEGEPEDGDSHSGRDDSGSVGDRPGEAGGDGVPPIGHKAKGVVPASVPLDTEGMSVDEIVREGKMKAAAENADAAESFTERINRINNALAQLRSALAAQRSYDKDTVRIITNLANDLLQGGRLSDMTRGEIKRLLSVIKDAVGKEDLSVSVDRLMDIMIANQLRFGKSRFEEFLKIKATKVNASGVEARGKLDVAGQQMMQYLKEGIASSMTDEMLSERIATEENNLDSESEVIRGNAENKLVGYYLARLYRENIKASEAEEKDLREEIKDAKVQYDAGMMDKVAYKEFIDSCYEAIRENRMQRVNAFESLNAALAEKIAGSIIAGKMLADAEKARIERIHHFANSDMEGMPSVQQGKVKGGFWNNTVLRFLFKPLATFDQMLRSFAPKSRSGEGYLWNHFMGGWLKASENEFKGIQKAHEMLDEKVRSVFKEAKRWSDLFAIEKRMPTMDVKFWDGEKMADFKLTQGNLLYIYMVSKMTDGKMKLSKMGITDVDVRNMVTEMDPRFIELADWIQESFLPTLREKYNEVHVRLFGAPMAAIDNYFPIRVLANARTREVDLAVEESSSKPSTITGSIIKRTKNSLALDILGSDAFDVVLEHIEQMEKWAAFAEFNKDLNTLLSYNKFRNRVQNSKGIYGSGTVAWNNFRAVAEIAAGVYKPAVKSDSLDKLITNIAKGVTGAKISFRVYTALKQFLSAPAFVSDASAAALIKNLANPYKAWTWAMNELPLFEKRWKSRQAGDSRLMETEADWELWKNKIVELAGRYGMTPNAFVDALTVSIGARAIYETKLKEYLEYGYSPERAEEKAKRDATVLFNESQQSNESAFLSAAQVDRTVASILITVFRNSSMGYQRMYVDGIRNIGHMLKKGYREQSIEFMKKQMVRDGLEEDKAARAAERIYNRSLAKNAARVATFGFLVQFAWNLGPYMAYLLMGDDDEEKKDMITDAAVRGVVGGPVEGLAAGQVIGTILGDIATGEDISEPTLELPATSDLENAFNQLKSDPVRAVNDMFNLLVQSGIGVNPQTITDAIVAIVDACNGDMETSKEVAFALMRILQTPQSQIDKLYKEEIGFAEDEGLDIRIHEFAERYAKYKVTRNAPLAKWLYSDEREKELEDRFIKRFLNDAEDLKRSQGSEEAKTFYEYYDVEYKKIPQTLRDLRKQAKENPYRSESLSKEANRILETDEFKLYEEVLPHIKMYEHHKKQMKEAPDGFTRAEEEIKMREEMEAVVEILRGREQE